MYHHLFSPIPINQLEIKNRILFPGMSTKYATPDGAVSDRMLRYYAARAAGGAGLVTVEASSVCRSGESFSRGLSLADNADTAGLSRLAMGIHAHGARASIQLMHGGRLALPERSGRILLVSSVPGRTPRQDSVVMTHDDIQDLIRHFAAAAQRAREAGFDAVELHGAHGYLFAQFFSPLLNRRTDEYGGSPENRMRFSLEVLKAVRRAVGKDVPILYRMSAVEYVQGGIRLEESQELAKALVREGIDALHVSVGTRESRHVVAPPACVPAGWNASIARAVKSAVRSAVPVIVAGRVVDENCAVDLLERGDADMVAMGRALIAAPDLPRLILEKRRGDIVRCISCNEGCSNGSAMGTGIACALNPLAGREGSYDQGPAEVRRRVLIVGGGPAGMNAALSAHAKGHDVVLCEAEQELGGLLHIAKLPPYKSLIGEYARWCAQRLAVCAAMGRMEVRTGREMTVDDILHLKPDVVILATGSRPVLPAFCAGAPLACPAEDILARRVPLPRRSVILGGGLIGCETADFLLREGCETTLVEMRPTLAVDMEARTRIHVMERLKNGGVVKWTDTTLLALEADGSLRIRHAKLGEQTLPPVEKLIIAVGYHSHTPLYAPLVQAGMDVRLTGDCDKVGTIGDAVRTGFEAGLSL